MSNPSSSVSERRRRLLQALGTASGGAALASLGAAQEDGEAGLVAEQADRCIPITPLRGSEPVEALYDYTYPRDRFDGPPGSTGESYSSEGTTDLQRDDTSLLFLYEGPNGLSLVVVHGHLDGATDSGGTVTFTFHGLPAGGQWVVRDDYYVDSETGLPADSNHDRWNVGGDVHTVDWAYRGSRTDGGAFRGLGQDLHVRIEPAFNGAAGLAGDHDFGPLESWELLSGSRASPERHSLMLDRPLVLRRGICEGTDGGSGGGGSGGGGSGGGGDTSGDGGDTGDGGQAGDGDDGGDGGGSDDDRAADKHERKQRKHEDRERTKHQRKQRKHQQKHERKQRKHRRKHERKQRKHEREQRKHEDGEDEDDD